MLNASGSIQYFDGNFISASEPTLGAFSPVFYTGPVPYETIRAYRSRDATALNLFRPTAHFQRLVETMKLMAQDGEVPTGHLIEVMGELIRRNQIIGDAHFRVHALATELSNGPRIASRTGIGIRVSARDTMSSGAVSAKLSPWRRPVNASQFARAKTVGNPSFSRTAFLEAKSQGFGQVIYLNDNGHVCECGYANIFLIRGNTLLTPSETCSILPGITRDTIIALASDVGIHCVERMVDPAELFLADEVFACSTGLEIVPIGTIDTSQVAGGETGPVTKRLSAAYEAALRGSLPEHEDWLVKVKRVA